MDPLAEKIIEIKRKKEEIERFKREEEEKAKQRKELILNNRLQEFNNLAEYLKKRIQNINTDLSSEELKYKEEEKSFKILYGGYYISFTFDYIYSNEPEGTQIIITMGKFSGGNEELFSINEEYYWIPKVPEFKILWTICNNYHIEGDIKNITIQEVGNLSLEKFITIQLK